MKIVTNENSNEVVMNKNNNQTVLVWGGAGYIGCVLVRYLLESGYNVIVSDNLRKGGKSLINFVQHPNFRFVYGDITNVNDVIRCHSNKIDSIILLSGIVGLSDCDTNPTLTSVTNVDGWYNVAKYSNNIPIIGASTGSVYGKIVDGLCTEESLTNPLSHYGKTKLDGEKPILDSGGIILRFATAGGVSPQMRFNLLPNELTFNALRDKTLTIYEPENMRTFIDIRDFARSLIFFTENFNKVKHKLYNVGDVNNNWSKKQLAIYIKSKTGCELSFHDKIKDIDARDYQVDYSRLNNEGFKCSFSIENMIDSLIKCYSIWDDFLDYTKVEQC